MSALWLNLTVDMPAIATASMPDSRIARSASPTNSSSRAAFERSAATANGRCSTLRSVNATMAMAATRIKIEIMGSGCPEHWNFSI
ncbi:hypothetical protein [Bradyrhizobium sp. USDA 4469]